MLVRVGEARRDCRQREGKGERLGLPRLIRVRSERRGLDIRYSEPAGFEISGDGVSEHGRYEETQDSLRRRTRSDDQESGVGRHTHGSDESCQCSRVPEKLQEYGSHI